MWDGHVFEIELRGRGRTESIKRDGPYLRWTFPTPLGESVVLSKSCGVLMGWWHKRISHFKSSQNPSSFQWMYIAQDKIVVTIAFIDIYICLGSCTWAIDRRWIGSDPPLLLQLVRHGPCTARDPLPENWDAGTLRNSFRLLGFAYKAFLIIFFAF